jgi:pimeloyl-ACP methyl ester carboxylesterase
MLFYLLQYLLFSGMVATIMVWLRWDGVVARVRGLEHLGRIRSWVVVGIALGSILTYTVDWPVVLWRRSLAEWSLLRRQCPRRIRREAARMFLANVTPLVHVRVTRE